MAETAFFSWQADTPTINGRNFLEHTLERALGSLNQRLTLEEPERDDLVLDKDTKGVAGQPPIVETIFRKIDDASIFVPDLTFVGRREDGRPTPNPNVLIEYGWALKSLGFGRIVPVMNTAYGEPKDALPFNMRHLRFPITYNLPDGASETLRKEEREKLSRILDEALGAVLKKEGLRQKTVASEQPAAYESLIAKSSVSRFRPAGVSLGILDRSFESPVEIYLGDGSASWLRLMPVKAPERNWTTPQLKKAANEGGIILTPLYTYSGYSELRGDDGIGHFEHDREPHKTANVVYAFEAGEVWAINTNIVPRIRVQSNGAKIRPGLPVVELERAYGEALTNYSQFLERLGVPAPYRWIAGIEGIKAFGLYYPPPAGRMWPDGGPRGASVADAVIEEGVLEGRVLPFAAVRRFFEKLFAKCGLERPEYLDGLSAG